MIFATVLFVAGGVYILLSVSGIRALQAIAWTIWGMFVLLCVAEMGKLTLEFLPHLLEAPGSRTWSEANAIGVAWKFKMLGLFWIVALSCPAIFAGQEAA